MPKTSPVDQRARWAADRQFAAEAVEALQSSDGWQAWLRSRRSFHAYSLANQLLIAQQCPGATKVAGFRAWLKLGYCVRRGERALRIWMPFGPSKAALDAWRKAGSVPADRPRPRFKLGPVFDVSQVDELPPPATPASLEPPVRRVDGSDLAWAVELFTVFALSLGVDVSVERLPEGVCGAYRPDYGVIWLAEDLPVNHRVKTLVHELAHALLRTDPDAAAIDLSYAEEELVVESTAYTVCGSVGLDTSGYSVPYLTSWSERADLETIHTAARTIDRLPKRLEGTLAFASAQLAA